MESESTTGEPTREEILEELKAGRRNIVEEADRIESVGFNCIESHHAAADGEIIVQLMPHVSWEINADESDEETRMMSFEETQQLTEWTLPGNDDDDDGLNDRLEDLHVVTDTEEAVAAVVRAEGDTRGERRENALERAGEHQPGTWVYEGSLRRFLESIENGNDFAEFY